MADERIPKALDAGVAPWRWRTLIVFILSLAAFFAAWLLAEVLALALWELAWTGNRWGLMNFHVRVGNDGDLPDGVLRQILFGFLLCGLPTILLAYAISIRLRSLVFLMLGWLLPFLLAGFGLLFLAYHPPQFEFLCVIIWSSMSGIAGAVLLAIDQRGLEQGREDVPEPEEEGIHRNPWRAWIILALGFLVLQASVPLAAYLHSTLWELLNAHFNTWAWDRDGFMRNYTHERSFNLETLRIALTWMTLYALPFILLVAAVRFCMRPWYGLIFGLLISICIFAMQWQFETSGIYESASIALLNGQCCGVVLVLLLWLYHAKVSKIRFVPDDHED